MTHETHAHKPPPHIQTQIKRKKRLKGISTIYFSKSWPIRWFLHIYIKTLFKTSITPAYHFEVKYKECNAYHNLRNQIIKFMGDRFLCLSNYRAFKRAKPFLFSITLNHSLRPPSNGNTYIFRAFKRLPFSFHVPCRINAESIQDNPGHIHKIHQ